MAQNQDVVLINIENMIKAISRGPAAEEPFSIFRVPVHLRTCKNNERYFEPRLVSVGPYHWKKDHLRAMEMHKGRYFIDFTNDHPDKREEYIKKIRYLLPSIKKCYFESINEDDLNDDDFVEMLLLDGCFIIYFLIKLYDLRDRSDPLTAHHQTSASSARSSSLDRNEMNPVVVDPVFNVEWNFPLISTDMLMLENQIPFIILDELYSTYLSFEPSRNQNKDLHELVFNFIRRVARTKREELVIPNVDKIHHLLHFYYEAYIPAMEYSTNNPYPLVSHPREKYRYPRMIPCATELQEKK